MTSKKAADSALLHRDPSAPVAPSVTTSHTAISRGPPPTTGSSYQLKEPKTSTIVNGRKRIESKFADDTEMVEEFDVVTDELLLRKVRKTPVIGGEGPWVIEVGSEGKHFNVDRDLIAESASTPQLTRQDTAEDFLIRIRNLPYTKDVFAVSIEPRSGSSGSIVVRTTNKKYFKVIDIPDLQRAQIALDAANLSWEVKFDTLIIRYKKPMSIRIVEAQEKKERAAIKSIRPKEQEPRCDQQ